MTTRAVALLFVAVSVASGAAGCGGTNAQANVGNTRADSAHLAAQATEPRTGDPTAALSPASVPTSSTPVNVGGATSPAPAPAKPGTDPAPTPAAPARESTEEPKRIGARHVLVQWMGSDRAGKSVLRSRDQALVLAQEVLRRARAGEDIGRLAVEYSDEPNAGARGGSLGRFGKGQMVGAFEAVAFKLKVGQISDIVETPFGYHIIQRTE
jgi:hypothetical protein